MYSIMLLEETSFLYLFSLKALASLFWVSASSRARGSHRDRGSRVSFGTGAPGLPQGQNLQGFLWDRASRAPTGTEAPGLPCPQPRHIMTCCLSSSILFHLWDSSSLLMSEEHILLFKWKESASHRGARYKITEPIMMGIPPRNRSAASGTAAAANTSRLSVATLCWESLGVMRVAASREPQQWIVTFSNNGF